MKINDYFVMSMYKSKEDLYKAKSDYYEKVIQEMKSCNNCDFDFLEDDNEKCTNCDALYGGWELDVSILNKVNNET